MREASEADLPVLLALSPRPFSLHQGPILLLEGERVLAVLQYQVAADDPLAAVITRLSPRGNGWRNGYPQRLGAVLQTHFLRLWVVPALRQRERFLLPLGFVRAGGPLSWRREGASTSDSGLPAPTGESPADRQP